MAASTPHSSDQLRDNLIPILKNVALMVNPGLDFETCKSQMDIKILNRGNKITATMKCLFCLDKGEKERKKYIQFDVPPNSTTGYWNPSNFKKHLRMKHMGENKNQRMYRDSSSNLTNCKFTKFTPIKTCCE